MPPRKAHFHSGFKLAKRFISARVKIALVMGAKGEMVSGVILAGGQARRMGGADKGLIEVGGRPLAAWALARLAPQTCEVIISANRNPAAYERLGARVIGDCIAGFAGPLAGIHAGLCEASGAWAAIVPCDAPLLPADLVARFMQTARQTKAPVVFAEAGNRAQPVFMLCRTELAADLESFLREGGRKIDQWYPRHRAAPCAFPDAAAFANINTPQDADEMTARLQAANRDAPPKLKE